MPDRPMLTPWLAPTHDPLRDGVYQVMWMGVEYYSYWCGRWSLLAPTTGEAFAGRHWKSALPIRAWRGLTEPSQ